MFGPFFKALHPAQVLISSFAIIILIGTALLMLPQASTGEPLSFLNALFTATSATCVTGLTVVNTAHRFTLFGKLVIIALIQIGGLGIITFSTFFTLTFGIRISIGERAVLRDIFAIAPGLEIWALVKNIVMLSLSIEALGAAALYFRFLADYPEKEALFHAIFQAVSAFNNAGFSTFPGSLAGYRGDVTVNLIVAALIIMGGAGFLVLRELKNSLTTFTFKGIREKITLHTKIVASVSAFLIASGFVAIFLIEYDNILRGLPLLDKILVSLFQSVTPRTAGFNTVDIALLTNSTLFLLIMLMFIGASPGSTGGGIKTATLGILMGFIRARARGAEDVALFKKTVPFETINKSIAVFVFSSFIIMGFTMILSYTELRGLSHIQSEGKFLETLFEVVSAFGTVGLSTGITSSLSDAGKVIIIMVMFIGRLGPLTISIALAGRKAAPRYRFSEENIMVG